MNIDDPMEKIIAESLPVRFEHEKNGLDFYLPDYDVYIEVKQFHSDRISEQMKRQKNVIVVQGVVAVRFMSEILRGLSSTDRATEFYSDDGGSIPSALARNKSV